MKIDPFDQELSQCRSKSVRSILSYMFQTLYLSRGNRRSYKTAACSNTPAVGLLQMSQTPGTLFIYN